MEDTTLTPAVLSDHLSAVTDAKVARTDASLIAIPGSSREYSITEVDFTVYNAENTMNKILCSICQSITMEPTMISPCQHTFCKSCIQNCCDMQSSTNKKDKTCPNCRCVFNPDQHLVKNFLQTNIIDSLRVPCLHSDCDWIGEYGQLPAHLKDKCQSLVLCECKKIVERCDVSVATSTNLATSAAHVSVCPFVKIACVCGKSIERGSLHKHVAEDCEETVLPCVYHEHGCDWTGKRAHYCQSHETVCKIRKLCKKIQALERRQNDESRCRVWNIFKHCDSFFMSGLVGPPTRRRLLLLQYIESYSDLKFPVKFGYPLSGPADSSSPLPAPPIQSIPTTSVCYVKITGIEMSGVLDFDANKTCNDCMLDIDDKQGIMVITFAAKRDRFFIFPVKTMQQPQVNRLKNGRVQVVLQESNTPLKRAISPVLHAHRNWISYKDSGEYPFVVEPTTRCLFGFNLFLKGNKIQNDTMYAKVCEFFGLPFWNETE